MEKINELTSAIIGCAYKIHSALGPGLLESAYEACLALEIRQAGLKVEEQVPIPLVYKTIRLEVGYRLDLLIANEVIVEIKTVDRVIPMHRAQLLTYLRLTDREIGLILNFNEHNMQKGIHRVTREYERKRLREHFLPDPPPRSS
ncbi:GxxExxY protein [bacterium]|nr:GxxExxY protein [bacterium]